MFDSHGQRSGIGGCRNSGMKFPNAAGVKRYLDGTRRATWQPCFVAWSSFLVVSRTAWPTAWVWSESVLGRGVNTRFETVRMARPSPQHRGVCCVFFSRPSQRRMSWRPPTQRAVGCTKNNLVCREEQEGIRCPPSIIVLRHIFVVTRPQQQSQRRSFSV